MQTSDSPSLIPVPFANSGTKNTIPTSASPTPGLASLETGFPPVTMTPIVAGGIPPAGADFNGILNLVSAASRWAQAGGLYQYNTAFSTAIGGYPKGALIRSSDGNTVFMSQVENNTVDPGAGPSANWQALAMVSPKGECRLALSGASLVLSPFGGNQLYINGANRTIPLEGVSLAATGLSVATTYCIYAYWTGSAIALEASTTGHSADSSTGVEIKTGDATRTLVGMARIVAGPAFKDDFENRYVLSWYNRQPKITRKQLITAFSMGAGPSGVPNLQVDFICWENGVPLAAVTGGAQIVAGTTYAFRLGLNGTEIPNWLWTACLTSTDTVAPIALTEPSPTIPEGYNFITLVYVRGSGSGTGQLTGSFNGNTNVQVQILG